jgi:hypothetical protein
MGGSALPRGHRAGATNKLRNETAQRRSATRLRNEEARKTRNETARKGVTVYPWRLLFLDGLGSRQWIVFLRHAKTTSATRSVRKPTAKGALPLNRCAVTVHHSVTG